jgi:hypothetical protein
MVTAIDLSQEKKIYERGHLQESNSPPWGKDERGINVCQLKKTLAATGVPPKMQV